MSKKFNFYGGTITYKGDTDTYLQVYNLLIDEAGKAKSKYRKAYKDWGDIETFLNYGYGYGISLMVDIFMKFSSIFMAHRYYNFSKELFTKHRLYNEVTREFASAFFDIESRYEEIENVKRADKERREYRKNTRSRVIGGGFGIQGAVKGMAMAGAINMGTGLAHSTYNMIGNLFSSMSASSSKSDLYDSSEDYICESLKQSIRDMMKILDDLLNINVSFDQDKAEKIIENIDNNTITDGSQLLIALQDALRAYPFEEYLYYLVDKNYNHAEENVLPIAEYFGVPVKRYFRELCTVNGYKFEDRSLADEAREHFCNMLEYVDETTKKEILPKFFKPDFLKNHEEKDALRFLLGYYYNLIDICPNNSAVLRYCNHYIDFFSKQLTDLGENIDVKALKANDTGLVDFIIALYRHYYSRNNRYSLYCGNDISEALRDEVIKEFDLEANSKIYLVDKEGSYSYSYILYNKGLLVENKFIDIEDLAFAKRDGTLKLNKDFVGNTIIVDEDKYSTVKSYDKMLELFKCIGGVARALTVKKYVHLLHSQSISNEVKHIVIHALGRNYYYGKGLPENDVKALYWLIQAALDNYPNSQYMLGAMYTRDASFGLGVKKDLAKAKFWIQIAANNGYQPAIDLLKQNKYGINEVEMATEIEVYSGREYMAPLKKMNIVVAGVNDIDPPKFDKEYYDPLKDVDIKPEQTKEETPSPTTENNKEDNTQTDNSNKNIAADSQSESVMPMFCAYCGKKLINGIQFCPYCGKKILILNADSENQNEINTITNQNIDNNTSGQGNQDTLKVTTTEHSENLSTSTDIQVKNNEDVVNETGGSSLENISNQGNQADFSEDFFDVLEDYDTEEVSNSLSFANNEEEHAEIDDKTKGNSAVDLNIAKTENTIHDKIVNMIFWETETYAPFEGYHFYPDIPVEQLNYFLTAYTSGLGIQPDDVLIHYDETGTGEKGFIITSGFIVNSQGVYVEVKNLTGLSFYDGGFYALPLKYPIFFPTKDVYFSKFLAETLTNIIK